MTADVIESEATFPDQKVGIPEGLREESLHDILCREYMTNRFTWATTDAQGTVLACYLYPDQLFSQPTIWAKLQRFRFIKADVKVRLKVTAGPSYGGALLVSWLPFYDPTTIIGKTNEYYGKMGNLWAQGCNPSVVLDASVDAEHEFTIPCRIPTRFLDIDKYVDSSAKLLKGFFGCVVVRVLVPLTAPVSGTQSARVVAHARFQNVEVNGPHGLDRAAYVGLGNLATSVVANGKSQREQKAKTADGIISGVAERFAAVSHGLKRVPIIGGSADALGYIADIIGQAASAAGFDKPFEAKLSQPTHPRSVGDGHLAAGLDSSIFMGAYPANEVSEDPSLVGLTSNDADIGEIATRLFPVQSFTFTGTSEDANIAIGVTPQYCKADAPSATYTNGGGAQLARYYNTPLSWAARFFRYWRGSMKYRIAFFTSGGTTAQFAVSWVPLASATDAAGGDYMRRVVDVNGSTSLDFSIPYCSDMLWKLSGPPLYLVSSSTFPGYCTNGYLSIRCLNPPRSAQGDTASVTMVVWQTCGEDLQFAAFGEEHYTSVSTVFANSGSVPLMTADLVGSNYGVGVFEPLSRGDFAIDTGLCMGETFRNLIAASHIYQLTGTGGADDNMPNYMRVFTNSTQTTIADSSGADSLLDMTAGDRLSQMFMFKRGTRRFRLVAPPSNSLISVSLPNTAGANDVPNSAAMSWPPIHAGGEHSWEVPYFVPWLFEVNRTSLCGTNGRRYYPSRFMLVYNHSTTDVSGVVLQSAGDNFSMGLLSAPPSTFAVKYPPLQSADESPGLYPS